MCHSIKNIRLSFKWPCTKTERTEKECDTAEWAKPFQTNSWVKRCQYSLWRVQQEQWARGTGIIHSTALAERIKALDFSQKERNWALHSCRKWAAMNFHVPLLCWTLLPVHRIAYHRDSCGVKSTPAMLLSAYFGFDFDSTLANFNSVVKLLHFEAQSLWCNRAVELQQLYGSSNQGEKKYIFTFRVLSVYIHR